MHYHIIGIAGAGMSAIANILLDQGSQVSGSDLTSNRLTQALAARGATLHVGHDPAYSAGADALIVTSAARADHPEVLAAQKADIPILNRADLWRDWSQRRSIIAVAGTHGKTTTTAMIALILAQAGRNPGFLIGSESPDLGTNACWGDPAAPLVIEADEYAHTFLALTPTIAVITNVEWDHPDIYPTKTAYHAAFHQFATQTHTTLLVCGDPGTGTQYLTHEAYSAHQRTYGLADGNDYRVIPNNAEQHWSVTGGRWSTDRQFSLRIPGQHNACNALAALAVADLLGIDGDIAIAALSTFRGTARRFEIKGDVAGVTVIDDYAHHPTEVRATLAAARARYGARRMVAYVQPHTYSRTRALFDQWPTAFADADVVLVGAIYGAREAAQGDDELAQHLADQIAAANTHHVNVPLVTYVGGVAEATAAALAIIQPGDVLLTLGAGDGDQVGMGVLQHLQS